MSDWMYGDVVKLGEHAQARWMLISRNPLRQCWTMLMLAPRLGEFATITDQYLLDHRSWFRCLP